MFDAMRNKASFVFEHRWVMAQHLGRPLRSEEWVDHRDGNKTNNAIENLRIYLKGKAEEGSGFGYGTYYHEWQMAEVRVRELERELNVNPRVAEALRTQRVAVGQRHRAGSLPFTSDETPKR